MPALLATHSDQQTPMIKNLLETRGRLPRLGIIRLGVKEKNAKGIEFPRETAFFVVPDSLKTVVGDRPTKLSVLFPSDDPHRVLQADYIRYSGKLLTLKCDGERFVELPKAGGEVVGACKKEEGKACPCGAKAVGRLNVILLDSALGVWQIVCGGEGRIADLLTELEVYRRALGRLTDIVFSVERVPAEVQIKKEDGSRMPKTGYPVHIRCEFTAAQALSLRGITLPGLGPAALPAAGKIEEAEDEATPEVDGGEEWDISLCFKAATAAGLHAEQYAAYLAARWKTDVDNLPAEALRIEAEAWREAEKSALARETLKSVILTVLKKAKATS